jgi:cytochrome oxidase assembly protein ShyY1
VSESARARGLVGTTLTTVICVGLLIGLGVWQLHRKVWKENLIAAMTSRLDRPPQPLPLSAQWKTQTQDADEFRRVVFAATFTPGEEALVYSPGSALRNDVKGPGYFIFAPAKLADGSTIVVDRGFVPLDRKAVVGQPQAEPHGSVNVVGYLRWPETPGMFTPAADVKGNIWFARDPAAMAAAHHWGAIAPFYVDQGRRRLPAGCRRRVSSSSTCLTTTCNTRSPGSAWLPHWSPSTGCGSMAVSKRRPERSL